MMGKGGLQLVCPFLFFNRVDPQITSCNRIVIGNNQEEVPGAGIEPALPQWEQDFKSCVSTYSTTRAIKRCKFTMFKSKCTIDSLDQELSG